MCGFEIGSTVKKGDLGYYPIDKEDFLDEMISFWKDENRINVIGSHSSQEIVKSEFNSVGEEIKQIPTGEFEEGVYISWQYDDEVPNKDIRGTISGVFQPYPKRYGKGEWTAKTLDDAKQMAIDFAENVS